MDLNFTTQATVEHANDAVWKKIHDFIIFVKSAIFVFTVFGNALTLSAVKLYRRLRTKTNTFIASLAIVDLLSGTTIMITALYVHISGYLHLSCDTVTKSFIIALQDGTLLSSYYHVVLVTIDRFIAIRRPLHYHRLLTERVVYSLIASAWLVAMIMAFWPKFWFLDNFSCHYPSELLMYDTITYSASYIAVAALVGGMYFLILKEVRYQKRKITSQQHITSEINRNSSSHRDPVHRSQVTIKDSKSTSVIFVIVLAFGLFWMPKMLHGILATSAAYGPLISNFAVTVLFELANTIGFLNAAVNVVIYAAMNNDFKTAYKTILSCRIKSR